jgi:hypothetical protein
MIFLIMVLVILIFVVLGNYDLHRMLYVKSLTQNAGDSSALVGARWQGITLNLIGDLNVMQAVALGAATNYVAATNAAAAIEDVQARLCFVGPMIGFMASQQAAKNNRIYDNTEFDNYMKEHAAEVANNYTSIGPDGQPLFPEPYSKCWEEYSAMLSLVANDGMAAGPDNMQLYTDYSGYHVLLMMNFYYAISSYDWCWFFNNEPSLLRDYENFFPCWWQPLPMIPHVQYCNSEIFGLGLIKRDTMLSSLTNVSISALSQFATDRLKMSLLRSQYQDLIVGWYCYDPFVWTKWVAMSPTNASVFPTTGTVKPQYDYAGADAVVRVEAQAELVTPGPKGGTNQNKVVWTAAAKPFGYLNTDDTPNSDTLVLPAFHDVRLIPVDASSAPSGGSYNLVWRKHIEGHLPTYMAQGPSGVQGNGCWYCAQLVTWENPLFRQSGVLWLSSNSWQCTISEGGIMGGGTSTGH